jgi:hypothetical protein
MFESHGNLFVCKSRIDPFGLPPAVINGLAFGWGNFDARDSYGNREMRGNLRLVNGSFLTCRL